MIYIDKKWLSTSEVLEKYKHISEHSHTLYKVSCDVKISEKCRKEYKTEYRHFLKYNKNNCGKLLCLPCSRKFKASGRDNPNTKYHNLDDNFFSKIDTYDKAYVLGWIASDGSISKRGFQISIHQKDIQILEFIQFLICKEIPIIKFISKTSPMCKYVVNSQNISKNLCCLLQINAGKKSNVVKFPLIEEKYYVDFIRGYFEGDGSIFISQGDVKYKPPYIKGNIRSNSKSMLLSINEKIGGIGNIYDGILEINGSKMLLFMEKLYSNNRNKLRRKFDIYDNWENTKKELTIEYKKLLR